MVEYAHTLSMTPVNMTDDLERRLNETFSPKQVVELTHTIAWENCRARFNRGFRIGPDGYARSELEPSEAAS